MPDSGPNVYVIGGPNGAGKSTSARLLLDGLRVHDFVNADTIARGISAGAAAGQALAAGRILLERIREYGRREVDFAFETTMASRRLESRLAELRAAGYQLHILYLWLPSPEVAMQRVHARMRAGGHGIPEETVRRRYRRGLARFLNHAREQAHGWVLYDNSALMGPRPVASGGRGVKGGVHDEDTWRRVLAAAAG